jgi:hypothetical protein
MVNGSDRRDVRIRAIGRGTAIAIANKRTQHRGRIFISRQKITSAAESCGKQGRFPGKVNKLTPLEFVATHFECLILHNMTEFCRFCKKVMGNFDDNPLLLSIS